MSILWLIGSHVKGPFLDAVGRVLNEESILLYEPLNRACEKLFPLCGGAFPLVEPETQISAISPHLIYRVQSSLEPPFVAGSPLIDIARVEELPLKPPEPRRRKAEKKRLPFSVSALIRAKNAEKTLALCLKSLASQTLPLDELLLVDSGSRDRTLLIAKAYGAEVEEIPPDSYYPGAVLNEAIGRLKGEVILFLNSDAALLTPESLFQLLSPFREGSLAAAFGRQLPWPHAEGWVKRDYAKAFPKSSLPPPWLPLSLCFAAMRRSAWEERPFYREAWGSEDVEWASWAKRAGLRIEYRPEATAVHSHNYSLRQIYARKFIEGEADAWILQESPSRFRLLARCLKSIGGDLLYSARRLDLKGFFLAPLRRSCYHFGYWRGLRWGLWRRASGSGEREVGQRIALKNYEEP